MTEWDDDENEPDIVDDDLDDGVAFCPACGAEMSDMAVQCPKCHEYVTPHAGTGWRFQPGWYVALAVLGILAVIFMMFAG